MNPDYAIEFQMDFSLVYKAFRVFAVNSPAVNDGACILKIDCLATILDA